jgi:hypothetical protein
MYCVVFYLKPYFAMDRVYLSTCALVHEVLGSVESSAGFSDLPNKKSVMVAKEAIMPCQSSFNCNHDERMRFACPSVFVVSKTSKAVVLS